ncbi:hypothetical protein [Lactiplantibacillus plantarum]|uniref:hypothetical protein n=1 Tax=Lactiplantibacillus plantarum TaxID=1590 RepID=UPI0015EC0154|nr:hypothetical protein [Lactiplantibacillus plantarum]MBA3077591.1 hypothetical protein [Lactiplantibacillus plantarum]MBA3083390.1 hypothetical protein [Lactiplantibacillus plantarum]MDT4760227.1 hypothetical protein [Lactiplantibacillus plantarum]MDY7132189.1 hypothetical protein [Lactiplantibacillus plantarum]
MGKPIYELSKLNDITDTCKRANITIERANRDISSILAISDLIVPTLKNIVEHASSYFELDADKLREVINSREATIYSVMCVLTEMGTLAMNIDEETAGLNGVIDDINSTVNGINDGINSILDGGNSDCSDDNSQGATDHE